MLTLMRDLKKALDFLRSEICTLRSFILINSPATRGIILHFSVSTESLKLKLKCCFDIHILWWIIVVLGFGKISTDPANICKDNRITLT